MGRIGRPTWLVAGLLLWCSTVAVGVMARQPAPSDLLAGEDEIAYVCPMHPQFTSATKGKCDLCKMDLVESRPYDIRDYELDLQTTPAVVRAGSTARLRFEIRAPGTADLVKRFNVVHDQRYHLFVISQDMEYFAHLHPQQEADGSWWIDLVLPKPGYYKVLSDFHPVGGTSQFLARPIVTAGFTGDLAATSAHLVPDSVQTKTVDDITATVTYDPPTFVPGMYSHLTFVLRDTATGLPITDLQTYLGAFGHTLIMSEDMAEYVHSHPIDLENVDAENGPQPFVIPEGVDPETLRGGPEVVFEGLVPKPGRYRAWTQFRRHNQIHTFTFTFSTAAEASSR